MKKLIVINALFASILLLTNCSNNFIPNEDDISTKSQITSKINLEVPEQTISKDSTISGIDLVVSNITVTNNAKLTLIGNNSVTINKPFNVEQGSELEVKN